LTNVGMCMRALANDPSNVLRLREALERTLRDANRASQVVTRLRALFSGGDKKIEPVDLNDATREVIALSASDLARSGIRLRTELAKDVPVVEGDRVQLQQVVLNLIRNASDAMSTVDASPRDLVIRTVYADAEGVRLAVQDSGPGIRHEDLERVFNAFYSTKVGGLGIGLAVCRTIVESHGGKIWATMGVPNGAVFQFVLPSAVQE
jgi:signal transduction histidine kinase